jgi:hypothetical protein
LVLALGAGPTGSTPTLSVNGSDAAVTVSGSGSGTLTLSGTASALRNFLNTQDRVLFNAAASSTAYSLTATLQSLSGGVVRGAVNALLQLPPARRSRGVVARDPLDHRAQGAREAGLLVKD